MEVEGPQILLVRGQQFRTERLLVGIRVEMLEPAECVKLRASGASSSHHPKTFDVASLIQNEKGVSRRRHASNRAS